MKGDLFSLRILMSCEACIHQWDVVIASAPMGHDVATMA